MYNDKSETRTQKKKPGKSGPTLVCTNKECFEDRVETTVLSIGEYRYISCNTCGVAIKERHVGP